MKKMTFIILTASISMFACKDSSKAMVSDKIEPSNSGKHLDSKDDLTFDMIISFISKGEGISRTLKPKIDEAILAFNTKHNLKISSSTLNWGKEGETDYNLMLKNLSTSQKKEFISSIEEIVGSSDMTHITYNQKSVHKR
jgi:hypothetical protein